MAKYSYFLGQSGGSGGGGDFALIKIEYPQGQNVTVTFDGDIIEAPDDSGLWMFGCDEIGTYTIAITGTTAEVEVEITTQGQIESVWISPQVINYALIYYLGNEFVNVAGTDEERYAISTGGWNLYSYKYGSNYMYGLFSTLNNVNPSGFDKMFVRIKNSYSSKGTIVGFNCASWGRGTVNYNSSTYNVALSNSIINDAFPSAQFSSRNTFLLSPNQNFANDIYKYATSVTPMFDRSAYSKQSNYFRGYNNYPSTFETNCYAIGFCKTDDISGLSRYGSDITTILSNAVDLFADITALNWMCLNCTGDFMISALSNTSFINAMNASPNKSILIANEHWNRFLALLSV